MDLNSKKNNELEDSSVKISQTKTQKEKKHEK